MIWCSDSVYATQSSQTAVASSKHVRDRSAYVARTWAALTLFVLQPSVTWAHVVCLVRGVIDRAAAPDSPAAGTPEYTKALLAENPG
ncbi:hypothetical protein OG809_34030 [Kribbella soli]